MYTKRPQAQAINVTEELAKIKTPNAVTPEEHCRLKMLIYGDSGVGKTTFAIQFPKAVLIDTEGGAKHAQYVEKLNSVGSKVINTMDVREIINYIQFLMTSEHSYQTIIIDSLSDVWDTILDECTNKYGTVFGANTVAASKYFKRLLQCLATVDMNVILTCAPKNEWGKEGEVTDVIPDCWRKIAFKVDLMMRMLMAKKTDTHADFIVKKTRLSKFETGKTVSAGQFKALLGDNIKGVERLAEINKTIISAKQSDIIERIATYLTTERNIEEKKLTTFAEGYLKGNRLTSFEEFTSDQANHYISSIIKNFEISSEIINTIAEKAEKEIEEKKASLK